MPPAPHTPAAEAQDHAALIVALDAGDLAGAELRAAESLAASCIGCAALVEDLAAIRGAMTALPVPLRRRDYRLTDEDAARLRPSGWRRLLEWMAAPGSAVRPLATGLATLGIAGLLLTSGMPGMLLAGFGASAGAATAPAEAANDNASPAASRDERLQSTSWPLAAPTSAPGYDPGVTATGAPGAPSPAPSSAPAAVAGEGATAEPTSGEGRAVGAPDRDAGGTKAARDDAASPLPLPALVSLVLLAAGLALLAGRIVVRRRLP